MQPSYEITFHPVDLSRFGKNPAGQPLYRVVWADSRKSLVYANGKRYILDRYQHGEEANCKGKWILEKWAPAEVVLGMTREQFEGWKASMPNEPWEEYPVDGEYEFSYLFSGTVDEPDLIKRLEESEWRNRHLSLNDRKLEIEAQTVEEERQTDEKFDNMYDEAREESLQ